MFYEINKNSEKFLLQCVRDDNSFRGNYTEKCLLPIWKRYIPLLIDLLISNNFSSMTFFCGTRILRVIGCHLYGSQLIFY